MPRVLHRLIIFAGLCAACCATATAAPSDDIVAYLEKYHRLSQDDVRGRMELADWCASVEMFQQQADLLGEVLKLEPDHPTAYKELLAADAKRIRPVEKAWAEKLEGLLPGFKLHHSAHFTLLSDADDLMAQTQCDAMEIAYRTFYRETPAIGLRPMPPTGRLVCVLFTHHDQFRDFQKRFEGDDTAWAEGNYSWRTNRVSFFNDQDHPAFKEAREKIGEAERQIANLREEMEKLPDNATARRLTIQVQLKQLNAASTDLKQRMGRVARLATLAKTQHEATHQLFYNSGLQRRGREYPFWLSEGLATNFEVADREGHASPRVANIYRLNTYRNAEQQKQVLPVSQLLSYEPRSNEDAGVVANRYAQAWAVMHYLWNRQPERLAAFIRSVDADHPRDWRARFMDHFGDDLNALDADLRAYLRSL